MSDGPLAEGSLLEGRYRIDRLIGSGGFGVVYAAWHLTLDSKVAIKVMRLGGDEADTAAKSARFLDEARTLSRLRHDRIVRVLDAGISPRRDDEPMRAWLAMEWCEGITLADYRDAQPERRHSVREVWSLLGPVIEAMAVAHEGGVVHRDIKPSNIMLIGGDLAGAARLIDFGIAKQMDAVDSSAKSERSRGPAAFTPAYAAPEQLMGNRTGPWTDVHAIALTITELLVADAPYGDAVEPAVIVDAARPTPRLHGVDAAGWEAVLARALALKTAERFPDARSLHAALATALPSAAFDATISSPYAVVERRLALTTDAKPTAPGIKTELETMQAVSSEPVRTQPKPATRTALYLSIAAAIAVLGAALWWGLAPVPPAETSAALSPAPPSDAVPPVSPSASTATSTLVMMPVTAASASPSASAVKTAVTSAKAAPPASTQTVALPPTKPTIAAPASPLSTKPTLR